MDRVANIKLAVFPLSLFPLADLIIKALENNLGPDPASALTHGLGEWALIFLLLSLAVSPARRLTGIGKLIRFRRMLGLFALFYAVLHLLAYLAFMLSWEWQTLLEDLYKRSYIIVGAFSLSILVALGVTSTKKMMKRLGKQWIQLHRLVYVAAVLAVIHFLWLVKSDYTEPVIYGAFLAILLLLRTRVFSFGRKH
ncbi:protein-methionine-sulfoxide reductase heme-binding subunit MsrQ [Endozoicomonas sp. GU-1]|uniref:sulfite oxidase heme-binding subunit YedZ n=1 Tax=Endozoicomonas sp. GU-1 TaxID=3009078 RepID=UPI0022B32856|nr:protein-methionine-sulfoxide reductase heme-binding subunit MsrQ [Endozoicomonas sp. GU-1]WBA81894.1 sulfoxide reductase heme-binding subunit YedZ [Endozoicomonas sp. GU-1]WBA84848.1 sulfoxide reductase heme-binding subunit YedZ [Endozoicomonas sp. GU-1]